MPKPLKYLVLTALLSINSYALSFSNLIVFGDSLSDNGNFPESPNAFIHSDQPRVVSNTSASFYVPFSNPVNLLQGSATPPLTQINQHFPWPALDPSVLAPQVPITINGKPTRRLYRSLSWTELFLDFANRKGITQSSAVMPSYKIASTTNATWTSINYAWGSALAASGCFDKAYNPIKTCTRQSVLNARLRYMRAPTTANRYRLQIPAVATQVQFFLSDIKQKRIKLNRNSIVVFWAGGNNMINAYNHLLKWQLSDVLHFVSARPTAVNLNAISTLRQALPKAQQPSRYYLFNLMNPGLTPGYYHSNVRTLAYVLSNAYNWFTTLRVKWYNTIHHTNVQIVPIYTWYQQAFNSPYFQHHLGQACQIDGGDFTRPQHIPNNCSGFMYWNDVHPAVDMQKITAYRFLAMQQ